MYVLRCGDGSFYTGMTNDVSRRLSEHASGRGSRYTRAHLPVILIGVWEYADRSAAMRAEAKFKTLTHSKKADRVQAQDDFETGSFVPEILAAVEPSSSG
jgi:putative endonuclease